MVTLVYSAWPSRDPRPIRERVAEAAAETERVILFAADVCAEAYRAARDTGETKEDLEAMGVKVGP